MGRQPQLNSAYGAWFVIAPAGLRCAQVRLPPFRGSEDVGARSRWADERKPGRTGLAAGARILGGRTPGGAVRAAAGVRAGRDRRDRPGRANHGGQRADGEAVRVCARRAPGAERRDAGAGAVPGLALRAPQRVLHGSADAPDGGEPGPVRAAPGRHRVPRGDQPVEHRDRGRAAGHGGHPRRDGPQAGGGEVRAAAGVRAGRDRRDRPERPDRAGERADGEGVRLRPGRVGG
jgi:hypothetical protein